MINRHLVISGRVQGVGFRWSTVQLAQRLGVTGWVANRMDGTVEVEVEGKPQQVKRFIGQVQQGPTSYARVDSCQINPGDVKHYGGFTVR